MLSSDDKITDWQELRLGSPEQRKAFRILELSKVMPRLERYSPKLIGTFPLGIQIDGSDLDIACHARALDSFKDQLIEFFSEMPSFEIETLFVRGVESVVANFTFENLPFEIFCQNKLVSEQYGLRHLLVESALLRIGGDRAKSEIRKLKQTGLKTEPAFAEYFKLEGEPYDKLYELSLLDEAELRKIVER